MRAHTAIFVAALLTSCGSPPSPAATVSAEEAVRCNFYVTSALRLPRSEKGALLRSVNVQEEELAYYSNLTLGKMMDVGDASEKYKEEESERFNSDYALRGIDYTGNRLKECIEVLKSSAG